MKKTDKEHLLQKSKITQIVLDSLDLVNQSKEEGEQLDISFQAKLFGKDGQLNSMDLVALLVDIEEALQDNDIAVSLNDEKAMSQSRSPFRDVPALVDYILTQIDTANA